MNNPKLETMQGLTELLNDAANKTALKRPFMLTAFAGFIGGANELTVDAIKAPDRALRIVGAITNLTGAMLQITNSQSGEGFSDEPFPIQAIAGLISEVAPINKWLIPYVLQPNVSLRITFTNTKQERAGWICFLCESYNNKGA